MYDVIIIGAGPAGLTAGLYASRAKLKTLIIEKLVDGGQIVGTADVENYPGAPEDTTGPSLIERMSLQAKSFGAEKVYENVVEIDLESQPKIIKTDENEYQAKTVIIATGAKPKKIGCPGESQFAGRGISYCATCDGPFSEGMHTYVIGGGDAAVEEAIFLTKFAKKVTIIHRRDSLRAAKSIQEKAFNNDKIDFMWNSQVVEVKGEKFIESFVVEDTVTGDKKEIFPEDGQKRHSIFVFIGFNPNNELFEDKVDLYMGYLATNENMETNVTGVYGAGDIRVKSLRQVVTATSDGAIAAVSAEKYIETFNV